MGSDWSVRVVLQDQAAADALRAPIQAQLDRLEGQLSTWRGDSDVSRYNRAPAGTWQSWPSDAFAVLQLALQHAQTSQGALDPSIGPLVDLWGFGATGHRRDRPDAQAIEAARAQVGWHRVRVDAARRRVFQPGGIRLDLSAVTPGYASDAIGAWLRHHAVHNFLVNISGEILAHGQKPDGSPWQIGIEWPDGDDRAEAILARIALRDMALATSGNYRNRYRINGEPVAHTIDPRDGKPVQHALISVTVLHQRAADADALATALLVMGPVKARRFAQAHGLRVLLVTARGENLQREFIGDFH